MRPRVLSLDAAGTLLKVQWDPADFAVECLAEMGVTTESGVALETYRRLLATRWTDFRMRNRTGDLEAVDAWWRELAEDWMRALAVTADLATFERISRAKIDSPKGPYFQPFDDVRPLLAWAQDRSIPMVVASNWDLSLDRILRIHGLREAFEHIFISMVIGVDKPHPDFFGHLQATLQCDPSAILHVGDHPIDDFQGALGAGFQSIWLDRSRSPGSDSRIARLTDLVEHPVWND